MVSLLDRFLGRKDEPARAVDARPTPAYGDERELAFFEKVIRSPSVLVDELERTEREGEDFSSGDPLWLRINHRPDLFQMAIRRNQSEFWALVEDPACLEAIAHNPSVFKAIPDEMKTPALCQCMVSYAGDLLEFVPPAVRDGAVELAAVRSIGKRAFEWIAPEARTADMHLAAIAHYPPWAERVPAEMVDEGFRLRAVQTQPAALAFFPVEARSEDLFVAAKSGMEAARAPRPPALPWPTSYTAMPEYAEAPDSIRQALALRDLHAALADGKNQGTAAKKEAAALASLLPEPLRPGHAAYAPCFEDGVLEGKDRAKLMKVLHNAKAMLGTKALGAASAGLFGAMTEAASIDEIKKSLTAEIGG